MNIYYFFIKIKIIYYSMLIMAYKNCMNIKIETMDCNQEIENYGINKLPTDLIRSFKYNKWLLGIIVMNLMSQYNTL